MTSYSEIRLCKRLAPLGCLDASLSSPSSAQCDSKCYPAMAGAFRSALHCKRTCLAASLKGLCQLQLSQQLQFARDADEQRPCSLRGRWLRGSPCGMTVPGSDGRPDSTAQHVPRQMLPVQGGGGSKRKGWWFWSNVNLLLELYAILVAIFVRNKHSKKSTFKFLICCYVINAMCHGRNKSGEKGGGNCRAAVIQISYFKGAKELTQRIHLHFNKHFLSLLVSFSHSLPARKTSSVWLSHPCLM